MIQKLIINIDEPISNAFEREIFDFIRNVLSTDYYGESGEKYFSVSVNPKTSIRENALPEEFGPFVKRSIMKMEGFKMLAKRDVEVVLIQHIYF
ncbi:MAG: hypothetical protein EOP06_02695 [Proteobacteria bacterium]|nr:MAG: hypothetical protein EOP06_02695 [Pseudomonadota bacterium]